VDATVAFGAFNVRQDQKRHERSVHTIRHGIGCVNPIRLVRQSTKRNRIP
jgi:hypothetical protein